MNEINEKMNNTIEATSILSTNVSDLKLMLNKVSGLDNELNLGEEDLNQYVCEFNKKLIELTMCKGKLTETVKTITSINDKMKQYLDRPEVNVICDNSKGYSLFIKRKTEGNKRSNCIISNDDVISDIKLMEQKFNQQDREEEEFFTSAMIEKKYETVDMKKGNDIESMNEEKGKMDEDRVYANEFGPIVESKQAKEAITIIEPEALSTLSEKYNMSAEQLRRDLDNCFQYSTQAKTLRNQLFYLRNNFTLFKHDSDYDILFKLKPKTTSKQLREASLLKKKDGRCKVTGPWLEKEITEIIKSSKDHRRPMIGLIYQRISKTHPINFNTLKSFIYSNKKFVSVPIENREYARLEVNYDEIKKYFQILSQFTEVPIEFVMNADESGYQDNVDAVSGNVIVLDEEKDQVCEQKAGKYKFLYARYRNRNRMTMLAAIGLDGSTLNPFYVVKRVTGESDLVSNYGRNMLYVTHNASGFIDSDIFLIWFTEVYIADLKERRRRYNYEGVAIIIMDGCSCHITPKVCLIASLNNVKIVLLPAHSSHLIQALDAIPFAVHKRKINYMDEEGMSQQSQDIFTNLNAWYAAALPSLVKKSFQRVGIVSEGKVVDNTVISYMRVQPWIVEDDKIRSFFKEGEAIKPLVAKISFKTSIVCFCF